MAEPEATIPNTNAAATHLLTWALARTGFGHLGVMDNVCEFCL